MAINIPYQNFKSPLFLILHVTIFLILFPSMTYSMSDVDALLEFRKSLANSEALNSWVANEGGPCQHKNRPWEGVVCFEGIVIGLHLQSKGLSGKINIDALSNLPGLRSISLEGNQFDGPMPQFNRLGSLKAIFLSNNRFSGQIPSDFFSKMESLKKVWLSNNSFSGDIPSSLVQLRHLLELHLENNQFSGAVPPFKQPPLLSLDLSNNQLQGEIPMSMSKFNASSFEGNPNLCGEIVQRDCNQVATPTGPTTPTTATSTGKESKSENNHRRNKPKMVAAGITISVVVLSLLVVMFCMTRKKRVANMPTTTPSPTRTSATATLGQSEKKTNINEGMVEVEVGPTLSRKNSSNSSSKRSSSSRKSSGKGGAGGAAAAGASPIVDLTVLNEQKGMFGLADLMKASAEVLGNGRMGSAYKAIMANGLAVAVKRMRELNRLERDAFDEEIRKLASIRHENVLPPLAYHYRKEEKLVVYEYVGKGSLQYLLHGDRGHSHSELNWPTRLSIIKGVTQGLHYIHCQLPTHDLPHGNLKSSNILINLDNEPLLSDYGFNTLANPNVAANALFAYRSPEAMQDHSLISPKSDIYCLGVVILEILTGKFPCQYLTSTKNGTDVVQWAVSAINEGRESGLLDPDMMFGSTSGEEDSMVELLRIGVACTEPHPDKRPCLGEVKEMIEGIVGGQESARNVQLLTSPRDGFC